jgi:hypothetical protein
MSGPGALLFPRFLRHRSYVSWTKYVCRGVWGSPRETKLYGRAISIIL